MQRTQASPVHVTSYSQAQALFLVESRTYLKEPKKDRLYSTLVPLSKSKFFAQKSTVLSERPNHLAWLNFVRNLIETYSNLMNCRYFFHRPFIQENLLMHQGLLKSTLGWALDHL